jgi:hypothetical protein
MRKFFTLFIMASCVNKPTPVTDASAPVSETPPPPPVSSAPPSHDDTAEDCSEVLTEPALKKGATVMLVGDSLAVGMSTEFKRLAVGAGYRAVTHAAVGTTTTQWLTWIKQDLKVNKPALVVVSLGTNDAAGFESVSKNPKLFEEFVKTIDESGAFVVWIGPPAISTKKVAKIDEVRRLVKSAAPIYFASEDLVIPLEDGIHTNAAEYKRWIGAAWHWMSSRMIVLDSE